MYVDPFHFRNKQHAKHEFFKQGAENHDDNGQQNDGKVSTPRGFSKSQVRISRHVLNRQSEGH